MLSILSTGLVLNILGYCNAFTLYRLQLLCRKWRQFITKNEDAIYRSAAIYHGFAEPYQTLDDVSSEWLEITSPEYWEFLSWKDMCRRRFQLENNWEGHGSMPRTTLFGSAKENVHKFKLDDREDAHFIITTFQEGGLKVTCMDADTDERDVILFELGKEYVRKFSHCEYSNGFLVFDRIHPPTIEIWRLSNEWDGTIPPSNILYRPDEEQINAPRRTYDPMGRGSFSPWALIALHSNPCAYRLVHPHLLVGFESDRELHIFDIPSARLIETIPITSAMTPKETGGAQINCVELSTRHAFFCMPHSVIIIPHYQIFKAESVEENRERRVEENVETLQYLTFPNGDENLRDPHYTGFQLETVGSPSNEAMCECIVTAAGNHQKQVHISESRQELISVHVSPENIPDFIVVTKLGIVYFVRDFERVFRNEAQFSDITLRVNMGASVLSLAFNHDRAVIQTVVGIFVFNLHTSSSYDVIASCKHPTQIPPHLPIFPSLSAFQLLEFQNPLSLKQMVCAELTRTAVWFDWNGLVLVGWRLQSLPQGPRMLYRLDFSPIESGLVATSEIRYMHR